MLFVEISIFPKYLSFQKVGHCTLDPASDWVKVNQTDGIGGCGVY